MCFGRDDKFLLKKRRMEEIGGGVSFEIGGLEKFSGVCGLVGCILQNKLKRKIAFIV